MTLDQLINSAHQHGYSVVDINDAMQHATNDHDYWDIQGPKALLSAVRQLREGSIQLTTDDSDSTS